MIEATGNNGAFFRGRSASIPTSSVYTPPRKETVCTMVFSELNPKSIVKWPRYFFLSTVRACQVLATFRQFCINDIMAGIMNSCLLFTFAAVFSSAIFNDIGLPQYVALGAGCHLISIVVVQGSFSFFSDVGITIAGPDINPAIFLASMANIARRAMIINLEQDYIERNKVVTGAPSLSPIQLSQGRRRLEEQQQQQLDEPTFSPTLFNPATLLEPEKLLSTVLAMIIITTVSFGIFTYVLGRLRVSRGIQLVPGSVLAGFMASIGWLVITKAVSTSMPNDVYEAGLLDSRWWMFFSPAVPIGLFMYFQRRLRIGTTVVLVPIILLLPLIVFFGAVYGSGSNIEHARDLGWLFPRFSSDVFTNQFVLSYGKVEQVDWNAIRATVPTMFTFFFIVTVDALLKQASIRKLLKAHDMRIDHELMLLGKSNILCGLLVGVVGYPQPKLTSINYGVLRNSESRVSGMIVLFFNLVIFLVGFPLINYLPRFWLAGILVFSAMGFLVENLWDSRLTFSRKEYAAIWVILLTSAFLDMAWAVLVGIVLSALIFAMAYSRGGAIKSIISGSEYRSSVVRSEEEDIKLELLASKAVVIQLHRYIFFGSAAYVNEVIMGVIKEQETNVSEERRANYFVFDWAHVEDVDVTATSTLTELMFKMAMSPSRTVLFAGLNPRLRQRLANSVQLIHEVGFRDVAGISSSSRQDLSNGIVGIHRRCFDTLDRGMEFVEDRLLHWAKEVREGWFLMDSFREFHLRMQYWNSFHSFEQVLVEMLGHQMNSFFEPLVVPKGMILCRAGDMDKHVYVLKEGLLTIFVEGDDEDHISRVQTLTSGCFVNEDALFGKYFVPYTVVADEDCVILALSREKMVRLEQQHGAVSLEIHRRALAHASRKNQKIVKMLESLNLWDKELASSVSNQNSTSANQMLPEDDDPIESRNRTPDLEMEGRLPATSSSSSEEESNPFNDYPYAKESPHVGPIIKPKPVKHVSFVVPPPLPEPLKEEVPSLPPPDVESAAESTIVEVKPAQKKGMKKWLSKLTKKQAKSTMEVARGVADHSKAVVNNSLILSGFRESEKNEREGALLNTNQIREGVGEEDGRRLAQQLSIKRTPHNVMQHRAKSNKMKSFALSAEVISPVRAFRFLKQMGKDVELAIGAIYNMIKMMSHKKMGIPPLTYRLPISVLLNAKSVFAKQCDFVGDPMDIPDHLKLAPYRVKSALAQLGLYCQESEVRYLTLAEFVKLATKSSMVLLPEETVSRLASFFSFAAINHITTTTGKEELMLTEASLHKVLPGIPLASFARFVNVWRGGGNSGGVDFSSLCSAVAQYVHWLDLDARVEADWATLSDGEEEVGVEDIVRVFGYPVIQAREMIWESDTNRSDTVSLLELLDTLALCQNQVQVLEE